MNNIKIVRRFARGQYEEGTEPEVYDIYFDVGLFSPLIKKWKIDKSALTREEAIKYIMPWLLDTADNKIIELFLELKEDKDKKIKEELIKHLKEGAEGYEPAGSTEDYARWLSWLEKQDEQKSDKVEPTLKVGDWCIDNEDGTIFQIVKVLDNTYTYKTNEGKEYSCTHYTLENDVRLWTIQDAKDGDVLAAKDGIFIYNGKLDAIGRVCTYGGIYKTYNELRFAKCAVGNYFTYIQPYPATKEQRALLFQKMKEAGYEWNVEKRELKEIVAPIFNIGDVLCDKSCTTLNKDTQPNFEIVDIRDGMYICDKCSFPISQQDEYELVTKRIEQKHTPKHKVGETIYYNSFGEVKSMIVANVVTGSTDNPMYEDENGSAVFEKDLIEQKHVEWEPQTGDTFRKKGTTSPTYHLCDKREDGITFGFVENREVGISGGEITIFALKQGYELVERPKTIEEELNKALQTKVEQKPVWSEEDESRMNILCHFLKGYGNEYYGHLTLQNTISWLKSLRPQNNITDAFIEKACEFISLNVTDYIDVTHKGGIEHLALQEKFIDGFKNYMKKEKYNASVTVEAE